MKRTLLIIIILGIAQCIYAQQKSLVIFGVNDKITGENIRDVQIELLRDDTVKVEYKTITTEDAYRLEFDFKPGRYTILVNKEGYITGEKYFLLNTYRNSTKGEGTIWLEKEKMVYLDEVTVKSTKIKMVMRGDTVVYDAGAFNVAEGSMLDALVAQLPGAELKDGQIKVNGKLIESLMVNGEDFFSGNPKIALQNLPAYTVKNIKVYDRAANDDYLKGAAAKLAKTEEHMVMDVILKKIYSSGFIGNADAGYGLPDNMYQGKLFGLGYFGHSRLAAFANVNNIKDTQMGSTGGNWNGGWAQEGEMDLAMGGVDYLYSRGNFKYAGNATVTHEEPMVQHKTSLVDFYESGDVFGRTYSESSDRKFHLMSSHQLQYSGKRMYVEAKPMVDYLRNKYSRLTRSAEFSALPAEAYRLQALDSLFAPLWTETGYLKTMLNRQNRAQEGPSDWIIAGAETKATLSFPTLMDNLEIKLDGKYRKDTENPLTSINRIFNYGGSGENTLQSRDYISRTYSVSGSVVYSWYYWPYQTNKMKFWVVRPRFKFDRQYYNRTNTLMQYSQTFTDMAEGVIVPPSMIQPERLVKDLDNSYHSVLAQNSYTPGVEVLYAFVPSVTSGKQLTVSAVFEDAMRSEVLDYSKNAIQRHITRFSHHLQPSAEVAYQADLAERKSEIKLSYNLRSVMPGIHNRLGLTDSSDPQNIYVDNPDLRRSTTHRVSAYYNVFHKQRYSNLSAEAGYSRTNRALAYARHYNSETGVSTWQPENIDGNWQANAGVGFDMPLGDKQAFQFGTRTSLAFVHSVDFSTNSDDPGKSVVDNANIYEQLSLSYKFGKHTVGIRTGASWLRSWSGHEGYSSISAWNLSAGFDGTFTLPCNWQVGTDLSVINRWGLHRRQSERNQVCMECICRQDFAQG